MLLNQSEVFGVCYLSILTTALVNTRPESQHRPRSRLSTLSPRRAPPLICPPPLGESQTSSWQTPSPPRLRAAGTGCASPSCPSRRSECAGPGDTSTRSSCGRRRRAAGPRPCRPPGPPGRSSSPSPSPAARSSLGTPYPAHCRAEEGI